MPVANTSNISTIQILRSYSNTTPTTLDDGQLAYSFISNTLFIGSNTGIKVISNPPTDLRAQEAYNQANTATVLANAAYFHANGAFIRANAAFDNSNTKLSLSGGTITGPISGPGESKLDFTTYGSNTVYLTTTNDDSTALFMGAAAAQLYASTDVQIRANTEGTSQNWTFGAEGTLTFPDNTIQTTAYTPGGEIDELARATANAAYFHANGAFLKANASFNQANLTIGVDASQNVRLAFSNTRMDISDGVNASQNVRLAFSNTRMDISDGVNTTQNTRLTVIENTDLSQNVRLNFSNTAITIIQGVDVGQNARMAIIEGTDASQNVRLDFSNTRMTVSDGVNVSQNVRLDFSNTRMVIIEGTDVSQNVRIDYSNTAITIIQGVDTSQNARMTIADGVDASQNSRLDYSNTAITIIQGVDTSQNARMVIIEGTDVSQNARMTIADGVDASQNSRLDYSNTALTIAQGVDNSQNVRIDYSNAAITIIQGTDTTQNTRLTVIEGTNASQNVRIDYSNAAITIIQGVDVGQNSRMTIADGVDASQNVRLDYSNTAITIIQGVDVTQNTRLTVSEGVDLSQNVRLDFSNTRMSIIDGVDAGQNARMTIIEGVDVTQNTNISNRLALSGASLQTVTGNVVFGNDVTVTGNLIVLGNTISLNVTSIEVEDTLIQLGIGNYSTDALTIGYVGHYNDGTNAHAGMIRDALTKEFYAFQGYTPEVTGNVINVNAASFTKANIHGNWFKGNLIATTARVGGLDVNSRLDFSNTRMTIIEGVDVTQNTNIAATDNKMQGAYNVANTADVRSVSAYFHANGAFIKANAAFDSVNVQIGVDTTQNTRMLVIEGTDLSQNVRLNFSNTRMDISDGVNASQNVRLDYSNTAITILQGVNVGQNSRMTIIEGTDVSQNVRLDYSNTALTIAQGVDNSQNVRLDYSNAAITIIQGVDVTQNTRLTVIEGTNASQNVRLDYSNTALTIAQGVDNSQNVRLDYSNTAINQVSSAWTANTVIVANLTGYLSNSSVFFTSSNNALITTGAVIAAGDISVATGQFVSVGGPGSGTRIRRDSSLNGLDLQTSSTSRLFIADADGSVNVRSTTSSTSNTTGALIVGGGLGVSGNVYSTGGRITINNGFATTGNSGTIFLGDSSFSKTFGSGFIFNSSISAQQFVANPGSNSAAAFTFSGVGNLGIYAPLTGVLGITANSANALFVVAPTSSVNHLQISGAVTSDWPKIQSLGTDSTVGLNIETNQNAIRFNTTLGGGGGTQQFRIAHTASAVNYLQASGNSAGNPPVLTAAGSDTNIDLTLTPKGTGVVAVVPSAGWVSGQVARINLGDAGSNLKSTASTGKATLSGFDGVEISSRGSSPILQLNVPHTASAVNYVQVTGAATGLHPAVSAAGSDTDVRLNIFSKGSGSVDILTGSGGVRQGRFSHTASAVNYLEITGSVTGSGSSLSAQGTDANVGINITPKGAGSANITSTATSTSNTTGSLVVNGGLGLTGNLSMNLASSGTAVSRLTLSPQGYFTNFDAAGNIVYNGGAFLFNNNGTFVQNTFVARGPIINDQGNNTVLFAGSSPVRIQNTAPSTSNTTGSLIVDGGLGLSGNLSMNLASSGAAVNRITLSQANFIYSDDSSSGSIVFGGSRYYYFNAGDIYNQRDFIQRGLIKNDQGNNTVLFAGSSPVKIQNGTASSNTTSGALVVQGGVGISGALNATTKSFNIPHPTKEGKDLRYGSLEGPEFGVYVRGTLKGSNVIELPDYWTKLVDANTITVSLTSIGKHQKLSVKEVKDNTIIINSDGWFKKEIHCYYTVFGERADVDKLDVEV